MRLGEWAVLGMAIVLAGGGAVRAQGPATKVILQNFTPPEKGATPYAGVIRDEAGNLYGTTYSGGTANLGVVYQVDTANHLFVLHAFLGGADGAKPNAGVIFGPDCFYGTTTEGGAANAGVVYKVDRSGRETVLYSFRGGTDGSNPTAGVILDDAGNLYGTTYSGGAANAGTVYKIDAAGHTVLYSFTGGADGGSPYAGVIRDTSGNLYGTAFGGKYESGVVYEIDATGKERVLHTFTGDADGGDPYGGLMRDAAGNLYGTTSMGGVSHLGTVFKFEASGKMVVLHSFAGGTDGFEPYAGVISNGAGGLYGTTMEGGTGGLGTVYEIDAAGQETVLFSFAGGLSGAGLYAGVIRDAAGNLYGTAIGDGPLERGVVYKLDAKGAETVLNSFSGSAGYSPYEGVTRSASGSFYGTTSAGGTADFGTVYKIDAAGRDTPVHNFTGGSDGSYPSSGVARDATGNLYGTTYSGGASNAGTVYKIDASSGEEMVLHSFGGGADGRYPSGELLLDGVGNLYGTTAFGGAFNLGTVYKIDATGQKTVIHSFLDGSDGSHPVAGVIRDAAGNLYGTTSSGGTSGHGTVYEINASGEERVLYSFTGRADGNAPKSGVIRDAAGNLYGTTLDGGKLTYGVVYKVDTSGQETVLHSFLGETDGAHPTAGVIFDAAGNLYGATPYGGTPGAGTIYQINPPGLETILYTFQGGADGSVPHGELWMDGLGNLYGTTTLGGAGGGGTVWELMPNP